MIKRLIVFAGLILALAAVLAYAYMSPWITVAKVRKAAQTGDVDTVNAHVDFPALRESLKAAFNAHMARELMKPEIRENPFALLGFALASKLGETLVDGMVTPDGVRMMLDGHRPRASVEEQTPAGTSASRPPPESDTDTLMRYESRDRFIATFRKKADPDDTFTLVWHRSGLTGWNLVAVRMSAFSK